LHRNCFLEYVIEGKIRGREDEEEDVSSYRMILGKLKVAVTRKRKP
jgi:hypothetical protein